MPVRIPIPVLTPAFLLGRDRFPSTDPWTGLCGLGYDVRAGEEDQGNVSYAYAGSEFGSKE
jgi:hypothetical protein